MSEMHEILVTAEGLKHLQEELEHLKTTRRKEVADRLKDAISYGDLSENSEYQEAKEEQAFLEGKIVELEQKIKNAKIVKDDAKKDVIHVGSTVELKIDGEEIGTFSIVGATEADPFQKKISIDSPAGKALLGKKKGAKVSVVINSDTLEYEVLKVS